MPTATTPIAAGAVPAHTDAAPASVHSVPADRDMAPADPDPVPPHVDAPPADVDVPADLDALTAEVADSFLRIANRHRQILHSSLGRHGVKPAQAVCLKGLAEHDGATQSEIAERMHLTRPSVTRILQRMERAGIVERRPDPDDQRLLRVYLTEQGRALGSDLRAGFSDYVSRTVALLPHADRAALARILRRWAQLADRVPQPGSEPGEDSP